MKSTWDSQILCLDHIKIFEMCGNWPRLFSSVVGTLMSFVLEMEKQQLEKLVDRVGDNIEGIEAQLRHLANPKTGATNSWNSLD